MAWGVCVCVCGGGGGGDGRTIYMPIFNEGSGIDMRSRVKSCFVFDVRNIFFLMGQTAVNFADIL